MNNYTNIIFKIFIIKIMFESKKRVHIRTCFNQNRENISTIISAMEKISNIVVCAVVFVCTVYIMGFVCLFVVVLFFVVFLFFVFVGVFFVLLSLLVLYYLQHCHGHVQ